MKYLIAISLAAALPACVTFRIPIGADEKYGSVDITAQYNPPTSLGAWNDAPAAGRNGLAK